MTIDPELVTDLSAVAQTLGVVQLSASDAGHIARVVRAAFVTAEEATWWWTALRQPAISLHYGNEDGLALLLRLLPADVVAVLVVTDDEHEPWPAFEGALRDVATMLREVRPFEYWLAPRDGSWVVFDTHENAMVVAGSLVAHARTLVTPHPQD